MDKKIKNFIDEQKIEQVLIFYIPKKGDSKLLSKGMCGHNLLTLSKELKVNGDKLLKEEKLLCKQEQKKSKK